MSSSTILLFAGAVFAVVAAVLGAYGFTGRALVVGVDLGTTFSAVAYAARKGQPRVAVGPDDGSASLPSVVAVVSGRFVVGAAAEAAVMDEPWSAVFDAKRVIGRRVDDPVAVAERARHGGRIVPHPHAVRDHFGKRVPPAKLGRCAGCAPDVAFVVRVPRGEAGGLPALARHRCVDAGSLVTAAQLRRAAAAGGWPGSVGGAPFEVPPQLGGDAGGDERLLLLTPQAVGCLVITELVARVAAAAGHATISAAVAAVPADFSPAQREATSEAYARAGVHVTRMQFEPVAAATAYGLHTRPDVGAVLVFDMGGGTTDVSVLYLQDGAFTVIGSAGDGHLGGEDFDDCLLRVMGSQLRARGDAALAAVADEVDAAAADEVEGDRGAGRRDGGAGAPGSAARPAAVRAPAPAHAACGVAWLRHEAERVKIALSGDDGGGGGGGVVVVATWSCLAPPPAGTGAGGAAHNVSGTVTRHEFEGACARLFDRTLEPVRTALANANVAAGEVDEVVLVGGSSRLPRVRQLLTATLARTGGLRHTVDPDLAVAIGAALVVD